MKFPVRKISLATQDQSRLADSRVAKAVREALGGFRELSPAIYDVLQSDTLETRVVELIPHYAVAVHSALRNSMTSATDVSDACP